LEARHTGLLVGGVALNVDDLLLAVDADDLAGNRAGLLRTTDDLDLIVLADGHGSHAVLLPELLREGSAHQLADDILGCSEVCLAVLAAVAGDSLWT